MQRDEVKTHKINTAHYVPRADSKFMQLVINSRNRDTSLYPTPASYRVNLNDRIHMRSIKMLSCQVPNSQNPIRASNNKLDFKYGGNFTVTITPGRYTGTQYASALQTEMKLVDAGFSVSYSSITNKLTIENPGNVFSMLNATGTNASSNHARLIGFSATDHTGDDTYDSDYICDLSGEPYVLLSLRGLTNCSMRSFDGTSDVFAQVSFNAASMQFTFDSHSSGIILPSTGFDHLAYLDLRWWNPDSTVYDFNNVDHSVTLEIEYDLNRDH